MISAFINDGHKEWDENWSKIQLAYNTVLHSGIKISPFFFNYGREAVLMLVIKFPESIENSSVNDSMNYCILRMTKIDEFRHKIESQTKKNSDKRLARANSNRVGLIEIKVGTAVYYPN